jgi:hypothetical protein
MDYAHGTALTETILHGTMSPANYKHQTSVRASFFVRSIEFDK